MRSNSAHAVLCVKIFYTLVTPDRIASGISRRSGNVVRFLFPKYDQVGAINQYINMLFSEYPATYITSTDEKLLKLLSISRHYNLHAANFGTMC